MERDDHELSEDVFIIGKHMGILVNDNNMENIEKGLNDVKDIGVAQYKYLDEYFNMDEIFGRLF